MTQEEKLIFVFRKKEEAPQQERYTSAAENQNAEQIRTNEEEKQSQKAVAENRAAPSSADKDPNDKAQQILTEARHDSELQGIIRQYSEFDPWQILQEEPEFVLECIEAALPNRATRDDPKRLEKASLENKEILQDNFASLLEEHSHEDILVWQSIAEIDMNPERDREIDAPQPDNSQHQVKTIYEDRRKYKASDDRMDLEFYESKTTTQQKLERIEEDRSFECAVPTAIAYELAELGPLEPETLQYLQEKFAYVEKHLHHEAKQEDHEKGGFLAASDLHSKRAEICPERSERAKLQIELLETSRKESPHFAHDYVEITYEANQKDASYEMRDVADVRWEKVELAPAMQRLLDKREEPIPELDPLLQHCIEKHFAEHVRIQGQELNRSTKLLVPLDHGEVTRLEQDLERLEDDEPQPGKFKTVLVETEFFFGNDPNNPIPIDAKTYVTVLSRWEALTIDEFQRHAADATPTTAAWARICEVDANYREWLRSRGRLQQDLHNSRSALLHQDREFDDYDR